MSELEVKTTVEADRIVVTLAGICDLRDRESLKSTLLTAVDAAPLVVVDLAAVQLLDSSGLHALVTAHQAARRQGRALHVANPVGAVAAVLDITGVGPLLMASDNGVDPAQPPPLAKP